MSLKLYSGINAISYMYSIKVHKGRKVTFLIKSTKNWTTMIAIIT
jgi:hypothetical protein